MRAFLLVSVAGYIFACYHASALDNLLQLCKVFLNQVLAEDVTEVLEEV